MWVYKMKRVAVLGCTGSIGKTCLEIIRKHKDDFQVVLLANGSQKEELLTLVKEFRPEIAYCSNGTYIVNGNEKPFDKDVLSRPETYRHVDIVVNGIVGLAGLAPTLAVVEAGKNLATANKESIVCGGELLQKLLKNSKTELRPVDSEHSTVWQCLEEKDNVKRIILTASGGAFRAWDKEKIAKAKAVDALRHPNWVMGKKVTIDCATLVNKGMEIIEAKRLFGIDDVDAVMHGESIVHSMVEMKDGTIKAGLSTPDMTLPIQYALTYPKRMETTVPFLDLIKQKTLTFGRLDEDKFPCFSLCKKVSEYGDYAGTVLNAADETAVEYYLQDKIGFYDIYSCIESALHKFGYEGIINDKEDIFRIDKEVREYSIRYFEEK